MLDFVQTLDELARERLDPLDVLLFNFEESFTDLAFPRGDEVQVWRVVCDSLGHQKLYLLEVFEVHLVLLVDVMKVLSGD